MWKYIGIVVGMNYRKLEIYFWLKILKYNFVRLFKWLFLRLKCVIVLLKVFKKFELIYS